MSSQPDTYWRLEWNDSLSVGIAEIDAEHQHFIQLVNQLNEAITGRMGIGEIQQRMLAILEHTKTHFAHEELLFREWNYPHTAAHVEQHAQLVSALQAILASFEHGCTEYELIDSGLKIKSTLIEHILIEDMKFRRNQTEGSLR